MLALPFQCKFHIVSKKKPGSLKRCEIKKYSIKKKNSNKNQIRSKFNHFIEHLHLPSILNIHSSNSSLENLCNSSTIQFTDCNS